MASIGVAIIGSGIFVKEQHLPAVSKCDRLSLKALYSRSLKSAEATAQLVPQGQPKPQLYAEDAGSGSTYQDLLKRDDIQAVIIALPILSQPAYVEQALTAGKHVLAEKPIAADVERAQKLIAFYDQLTSSTNDNGGEGMKKPAATLSIAENLRFHPRLAYASEQGRTLGRITHFSIRVLNQMKTDTKWYNTAWRKDPGYQGGFLLDGGVHWAAASRLFLAGDVNAADAVQAYTDQVQSHLPPVDTVNAIIKTRSGASGAFQHSAGSLLQAFEWHFGYEGGTVQMVGDSVTVTPVNGEPTSKDFPRTSGVAEEVEAWAQGIADAKPNPLQSPQEALADLEFLEKMFRSGEENGARKQYEFQ